MKNPPSSFTIFGRSIAFYGVIMSCAIIVAAIIACTLAKKRNLNSDKILTVALFAIPLGIIGARFLHVMLNLKDYTFYEAIAFWKGWSGLSIYGAVLFGAVGVVLACVIKKINFLDVADVVVPGIIIAQAIGRWGNFFNQELYGPVVNFKVFPFSVFIEATGNYHLGIFFIESLCNVLGFVLLLLILKKVKTRGVVMCAYFMFYGLVRFVMEFFRTDAIVNGFRPYQIISIILFIFGGCFMTYLLLKEKKQKGKRANV